MAKEKLTLPEIKQRLDEKGFSHFNIALGVSASLGKNISKAIVTKTLNGCYDGADSTKEKVISYCIALIEDKPLNISNDILDKSRLYEKLMKEGSLLNTFSPEEREHFIKVYKALKQYNKNKLKQKAKKQAA